MSDDNVHPANTMQLLIALTNAVKMQNCAFTRRAGAAYNRERYMLVSDVSFQFLEGYLKGNSDLPNLNGK